MITLGEVSAHVKEKAKVVRAAGGMVPVL
jgi:hypothetical protein